MSKDHCEECDDLGCAVSDQKDLKGVSNDIFKLRYASNEHETWEGACSRTADAIGANERNGKKDDYISDFKRVLCDREFIPGGRILRNAGKVKGMLLNCFGLGVEDNIESIGQLIQDALIISKYGGGIGFDSSNLRPKGDQLKTQGNNAFSSGVISFIDVVDYALNTIKGGGDRRAAGLTFMGVWHPEIFNFIESKIEEGKLSNFNISVGVNNAFIQAVKKNKDWDLTFNNKVYKTIKARDLWDFLIGKAWKCGDPGLLNLDNMYLYNPLYYCETALTPNPCVTGDTIITTTMGDIPIKNLTKYKQVEIYSRTANGNLVITPAKFFRTKTCAKVITVRTSRGDVRCTPEHKFITADGEIMAKDLNDGQKLIGLLRKKSNERYLFVGCTGGEYSRESKFVTSYYYGADVSSSYDVHHLDGDQYNNAISNLQLLPHYIHSILSNNGHKQWNEINEKGQYVAKDHKKRRSHNSHVKSAGQWIVVSVEDHGELEPVFDGTVERTHCYFANGILVHNCGELIFPPYNACDLGTVNLNEMYDEKKGDVNWKRLKQVIYLAVRFLDNVLDVSHYPLPQIEHNSRATRRIGLGVMGLHYLMLKMGINDYGSKDSIEFMEGLLTKFRNYAYEASIELAKERGPFEKFEAVPYLDGAFARTLPRRIRKDIELYGLRNGTVLSMPPTGTTSLVAGVSQGIEPIFCPIYKRKYNDSSKSTMSEVREVDPLFKQFISLGRDVSHFIGAYEITPEKHMEVQVTAQQYVDNAISKTILLRKDYPQDKLSKLLLDHIQDVKGVTVYREGSKGKEILTPCDYKLPKEKLKKLAESA